MIRFSATLLLLALALGGCAQINKPITPDDGWRGQTEAFDNSLFQ